MPVIIPNTFASATTTIPLSQLDDNFDVLASSINSITSGSATVSALSVVELTATSATISVLLASSSTFTDVTVSSTTDLNGDLSVSGAATFSGTLTGLGTATFSYVDINDGLLDNVDIGQTTPGAGSFTTLDSTSTTTLNGTTIPASKTLVDTDSAQSLDNKTLNSPVINTPTFSGSLTFNEITAASATIGATLTVSGTTDLNGTLSVSGIATFSSDVNIAGDLSVTGSGSFAAEVDFLGPVNIAGATDLDGTLTVSGTTTVDTFIAGNSDVNGTLTVSGAATFSGDVNVVGDLAVTGSATFSTEVDFLGPVNISGTTTVGTINATTVDTTNIEVTNLKAKDGTAAGSIADSTGVVTIASSVLTTTDINGGTIDGTTIGASSPSTGAFTTLAASSTVTLSGGTANGVLYLNGSKVATSGSALTFDGTNLGTTGDINSEGSEKYINFRSTYSIGSNVRARIRAVGAGGGSGYGGDFRVDTRAPNNAWNTDAFVIDSSGQPIWTFGGSEQMRLTSTGLGIGTSSPSYKLDIITDSNGFIGQRIRNNDAGSSAYAGLILNASGNSWGIRMGSTAANSNALQFAIDAVGTPSTQMTLTTSGNLGLGVTPSGWSGVKAFEIQNGGAGGGALYGSSNITLGCNHYYDGTNWKYKSNGYATAYYQQYGGLGATTSHVWLIAPSGTAGNAITFTQAMTLDASGNLLVGATTSAGGRLQMTGDYLRLTDNTYTGLLGKGSDLVVGGAASDFAIRSESNILFAYGSAEKMRIDSSGNLGLGVTPSAWNSSWKALDVGARSAFTNNGSGNSTDIWHNGYVNTAGDAIYKATAAASFYRLEGGAFKWFTAPSGTAGNAITFTQAMTLDASGNLLVGTTSSTIATITQNAVVASTANGSLLLHHENGNSGSNFAEFGYANSTIGTISQNSTTTVGYNTSSDYRLKNTITPMTGALAKVALLKPVTYRWNVDGSDGQGFIAHELQEVVPECVTGEKDAVDADGNPVYQGVDTSFLVATLTAAIQELKSELDSVKAELATLKG